VAWPRRRGLSWWMGLKACLGGKVSHLIPTLGTTGECLGNGWELTKQRDVRGMWARGFCSSSHGEIFSVQRESRMALACVGVSVCARGGMDATACRLSCCCASCLRLSAACVCFGCSSLRVHAPRFARAIGRHVLRVVRSYFVHYHIRLIAVEKCVWGRL